MRTVNIGRLVDPVVKWNPRKDGAGTFTYIDISSIDQRTKAVAECAKVEAAEAPSRARQIVAAGDVLVSTVRPNLNAVAYVQPDLDGATASTGFCVLRPRRDELDGRYLYHWVQAAPFVGHLVRLATGASYPAVSDKIVKSTPLPLPPIEEQRRIAAVLDAAEALRAKRREALAKLDSLTQAIFIDMFGNGGWDTWSTYPVAELAAHEKGSIRTGPFGSQLLHEEFVDDGPIAVLGIDNAVENRFLWGERRFITNEKYQDLKRYTVRPGDVLITIMGTCGRTAIVPEDIPLAINTKHLCCITLDRSRCLPEFLWACLRFHPGVLRQLGATRGAVMPGLNMGLIKRAEIPVPPIGVQERFSKLKADVDRLVQMSESHQALLDQQFASLQQRAFRGEL